MSLKLKALGLALLAALAVGALSVMSATAETGGSLQLDAAGGWTKLHATQIGTIGENEYIDPGLETAKTCEIVTANATTDAATETSITFTDVKFEQCHTTAPMGPVVVDVNGCDLNLSIGKNPATQDQTASLGCPPGQEVTFTMNPPIVGICTFHIPPQTAKGGVVFKTGLKNSKHDLTATVTVKELTNVKTETGFGCLGTAGHNVENELFATITIEGKDTANNPVNITATGPGGKESGE